MPDRPNPLQPAPWIQDLVKDKPLAPKAPEVTPVVPPVAEKPVEAVTPPVVEEVKAPVATEPVVTTPVVEAPAVTAPSAIVTPAAPVVTPPVK